MAYGASAIAAGTTNYFVVDCNSTYLPFTSGLNWSAATNGSATGVAGSTITQTLPGYAYLSGLYKSYRIVRSTLSVSSIPEIGGDSVMIQIFAYPATSSFTLPLAMSQASQQQGAKMKVCAVGVAAKFNTVSSTVNLHDVIGMSRAEYDAQPPTLTGSAASGIIAANWAVQVCTADGQASGSTGIPLSARITYDVEWLSPNIPLV